MIKTNELRGVIVAKGYSQSDVAQKLGMTPKTFYGKMQKGVFDSDEIMTMIELLEIQEPMSIFFVKDVT